ncbi:polysaccharide biosynthesis/export family protein [Xinfangfangia pollutisoli]|uniref:polysaccharide biosynthesis/export family protein n=1 Tax=Xinfangfangia pollutisoli TaxID=2865960 RepID=UPI001CD756FA|nr:polysaccharide biosynthesis/export family protein [Xinfangfangia pollutisoli]
MKKSLVNGPAARSGLAAALFALAGCGAIYTSPEVGTSDDKVRVVDITAETAMQANRSAYEPKALPEVFFANAGYGSPRGIGALPEPVSAPDFDASAEVERLPPTPEPGPYRIGRGDVIAVSLPSVVITGSASDPSLMRRGEYAVQDDGAISLPDIGRLSVGGLTLSEAEAALFQRLVDRQMSPTFSIEVSQFVSSRVAIGGAVRAPGTQPVGLTPLYLDEALSQAGGVDSNDEGSIVVRLFRDGELYTVPLKSVYAPSGKARVRLVAGDSVFVDLGSDLTQAQAYFAEQIKVAELRQSARQAALEELASEIAIRRGTLEEERSNFSTRMQLDAVDRDYVYLTGEVGKQGRYPLPFGKRATLADALYGEGGGVRPETGDVSQIYVLRGSDDPRAFGAVTAWQLDTREATHLVLATKFELRPNDVIFIAEQPVTRWGRVIKQITPTLIATSVNAAQ